MNKKKLIIGIVAIVAGVIFAGLGFLPQNSERQAMIDSWKQVKETGIETEGTVVSIESDTVTEGARRSRHIDTVYCPVYQYTVGNDVYTVRAVGDDCKETRDEVVLGSTATVAYKEAERDTAFVKSDATEAFYANSDGAKWIALGIGLFLVLLGVLAIRSARPKTPEQLAKEAEAKRQTEEELARLTAELDDSTKK